MNGLYIHLSGGRVFPFVENDLEKRPRWSLMSKLPSDPIPITTAFLTRHLNDLGWNVMGCLWKSSGVALFLCEEQKERRERMSSALPSLTDSINWYLNSVLFRNINIMKGERFHHESNIFVVTWAILKKQKQTKDASKHSPAQTAEDEAKWCPWSSQPFSFWERLCLIYILAFNKEREETVCWKLKLGN